MTTLLKKAFAKLDLLPRRKQDSYARTILEDLSREEKQEELPPLTSFIGAGKGRGGFKSPEEADRYLEAERDSWDS